MKYAIVKVTNGTYAVAEEGFTDLNRAKSRFHTLCASLWNAADVETACVKLVDENLDVVEGDYKEFIDHREPEPQPESE